MSIFGIIFVWFLVNLAFLKIYFGCSESEHYCSLSFSWNLSKTCHLCYWFPSMLSSYVCITWFLLEGSLYFFSTKLSSSNQNESYLDMIFWNSNLKKTWAASISLFDILVVVFWRSILAVHLEYLNPVLPVYSDIMALAKNDVYARIELEQVTVQNVIHCLLFF
jgi:hypothetical protein